MFTYDKQLNISEDHMVSSDDLFVFARKHDLNNPAIYVGLLV